MQYRTLGKTGLAILQLSFGTMRLPLKRSERLAGHGAQCVAAARP